MHVSSECSAKEQKHPSPWGWRDMGKGWLDLSWHVPLIPGSMKALPVLQTSRECCVRWLQEWLDGRGTLEYLLGLTNTA